MPIMKVIDKNLFPYTAELTEESTSLDYYALYCDTDNDDIYETIQWQESQGLYILVKENNGQIRYALPVNGDYYMLVNKHIVFDYNKNGIKELYVFTGQQDSLILNIIELYPEKEKTEKNIISVPVDKFEITNSKIDCAVYHIQLADFDNDNNDEVVFTGTAGYSLYPRKVYMYNIAKNELKASRHWGADIVPSGITDVDNDGNKEILLKVYDVNNHKNGNSAQYPDTSAYIMILNKDLEFIFEPIKSNINRAQVKLFTLNGQILCEASSQYPNTTEIYSLHIKDNKCIIDDTLLSTNELVSFMDNYLIPELSKGLLFNWNNNKVYQLNEDLSISEIREFPKGYAPNGATHNFDLDNDRTNEIIFTNNRTIKIYSVERNKILAQLDNLNMGKADALFFSTKKEDNVLYMMLQYKNDKQFIIKVTPNKLYVWRFVLFLLGYIVLFGLLSILDIIVKIRVKKSLEIRHKLQELQLLNSKSQISPHFLFNALNSISSLIYKEDKEKAYDFITRFSKLHRSLLENSDQVFISLHDELEFLENYLVLQKLRYKERLEYEILCNENVNTQINVPKMLIQGYVENAIKHGLMPKSEGGKITINITQTDILQITIEDNGVGMEASSKIKNRTDSTGKGMRINKQIFELLEELYKYKIKFSVENLDEYENIGTRIVLGLPVKGK